MLLKQNTNNIKHDCAALLPAEKCMQASAVTQRLSIEAEIFDFALNTKSSQCKNLYMFFHYLLP